MTNKARIPYTEEMKTRVREMREAGYSTIQITQATGVPGSTILRWAAEGGWRVSDLSETPDMAGVTEPPAGKLHRDAPFSGFGGGEDEFDDLGDDGRVKRIEAALERAITKAERAVGLGNLNAATKAAQMVASLTRSLERFRRAQPEDKPEGVFYTPDDIARAREEITRRLMRLGERFHNGDDPTSQAFKDSFFRR